MLTRPRQDEVIEGRGSNQALGQRTPTGLGIRMQNHTPPCRRSLISQRGMSDGHTLPQGRNGSANQRPMRRNGWGQLVGEASGPRQLRKKPSRDPPISPPYSHALRSTFIMADLLVDSRAPEQHVCALARAQPPPDATVLPRSETQQRCGAPSGWGGMEGSATPSAAAQTQRWAEGQPA